MHLLESILFSIGASIVGPDSGFAGDPVATWGYANRDGTLSVSVDMNGRCAIGGQSRSTGQAFRVECGYWVVGSNVHLRLRHPSLKSRPVLVLEHRRELDELVVPGDTPLILSRQPLNHRSE
jgi:hypothetical protein